MKRLLAIMMVLGLLCPVLGGCQTGQMADATAESTDPTESVPTAIVGPKEEPDGVTLGDGGAIRVDYAVNRSSVHYVTSPSQLPDYEELEQFDDAYFRNNALLLVYETVSSGNVEVSVESVDISGGRAEVTLARSQGGSLGTAVMTTWLVWVQVEQGLHYEWTVANPAMESNVSDR